MLETSGGAKEFPNAGTGDQKKPIRQTILLVEDEEMVRELMCEVLERAGYAVLPCANPKEGIEVSNRHRDHIDLLLTDVVMPGMNGREMANRIQENLPRLRVVFMSGYTEHALTQDGQVDPNFEYLQKPFTLKTLTQKLAKVLGGVEGQAR
jgi:two-component system, cell cycle sensor histidine kinase and response regulator CckA